LGGRGENQEKRSSSRRGNIWDTWLGREEDLEGGSREKTERGQPRLWGTGTLSGKRSSFNVPIRGGRNGSRGELRLKSSEETSKGYWRPGKSHLNFTLYGFGKNDFTDQAKWKGG